MDTDFQAVAEQAVAKDAAAVRRTLARKESVGARDRPSVWFGPERRVAGNGVVWTGVERRACR